MRTDKHTIGPWKLSLTDDTVVIDADGREVAAIDGDYNNPDEWPKMEANAKLIAAAPDLLAALKDAQKTLQTASRQLTEDHKMVLMGRGWGWKTIATIEGAIAKAEGRSI